MKILVTGGAGFIGSNFVRYLLRAHEDCSIINLDKLTYAGNLDNLKNVESDPRYEFVRGDIADESLLEDLMSAQLDAVVNFAAESHVDRSIEDASSFIQTNVVGIHRLLEAARRYSVPRFIQVSTDEVYGSLGPTGRFTESTPLAPNSPYAASKASADLLVKAYVHTYGFPGIITRCSNNYGPYQFPEKLIPLLIHNAWQNKPLPIYGDGQQVRDWLYVEDHCRALDVVLARGKEGEVYNIGGNNEWRNLDIAKLVLKEMQKPESLITFVRDRPGHDRRYAIDARKVAEELGWTPQTSFEQGIRQTIHWYQTHSEWLEKIVSGDYQRYYERMYSNR